MNKPKKLSQKTQEVMKKLEAQYANCELSSEGIRRLLSLYTVLITS